MIADDAPGTLVGPTLAEPNPLRFLGATGTYHTGFALVFSLTIVRAKGGVSP